MMSKKNKLMSLVMAAIIARTPATATEKRRAAIPMQTANGQLSLTSVRLQHCLIIRCTSIPS